MKEKQKWESVVTELRQAAREKGVTQEMISERTGLIQSNISRMFGLKFTPTLKNIISIASAIGLKVKFEEVRDEND